MGEWIYRRVPVNRYDVARLESWLEDLSEEGLELAGISGPFGLFREVPARRRKCRLEPADMFPEERLEEELISYIRCGWGAVADIEGVFYVFMSTVPEPIEVHTDPVAQAYTYRNLVQKQRFYCYEAVMTTFLHAFIIGRPFVARWGLFGGFVKGQMTGFVMLMIALAMLLVRNVQNIYYLSRTMRRLKRGEPIAHTKDWRMRGRIGLVAAIVMAVCLIGGAVLGPFGQERKGTRNYEEVAAALPVLELADLEGEGFVYDGRESASGMTIDNSVYYYWALLAPESYEVVQTGQTAEKQDAQLKVDFCRTAFLWLAKGYCQERLAEYEEEGAQPELLAAPGIDEGWIWAEADGMRMLLRKGKVVMDYYYEGPGELADHAQAAAERSER